MFEVVSPFNLKIEFLPLQSENSADTYYALNVLDFVALDLDRSIVSTFSNGRILAVEEYAFNLVELSGTYIFLPEQAKHQGPIVTDAFMDIIIKNNLQGLIAKPVFEY